MTHTLHQLLLWAVFTSMAALGLALLASGVQADNLVYMLTFGMAGLLFLAAEAVAGLSAKPPSQEESAPPNDEQPQRL